jgi:hypothetical protein
VCGLSSFGILSSIWSRMLAAQGLVWASCVLCIAYCLSDLFRVSVYL